MRAQDVLPAADLRAQDVLPGPLLPADLLCEADASRADGGSPRCPSGRSHLLRSDLLPAPDLLPGPLRSEDLRARSLRAGRSGGGARSGSSPGSQAQGCLSRIGEDSRSPSTGACPVGSVLRG